MIFKAHLEIFTSHLFLSSLEPPRKHVFIPTGLTKGNPVSMGHYKEILQVSTNDSSSNFRDFTSAVSKTLGPKGKVENRKGILWSSICGYREPGGHSSSAEL